MSVLTKVFVVLLTVSSIALSMFVVAALSQQHNWKSSAEDWEQAALAAQAKERNMAGVASLEKARALDMHQKDLEAINSSKADLEKTRTQLKESELALAQAKNHLTEEQGQVSSAQDGLKLVQAALNREKEFSAKLATRNSELERGNIDLTDRVKELTVNVEMARAQVRALQQQIAAADSRQTSGASNVVEANSPTVSAATPAASIAPIRGEVRDVKGTLASISVGSADGVAHGMTFLIYRKASKGGKPQYLGSLKISRVDATESAGEIEQSAGDIRAGDTVRDEASFAMKG